LKPPADLDISGWDELFVGIHQSLALWTKTPELEIEPSEAQLLANAAGKVARWYKLPGVAQKTIDWANLAMALNVVYGPRVVVMRARKAQEAQEARTRRPTVVPFPNARSNAPPAPDTPAQATDAKTDERARMMDLARFVPTGEPQ
jgi:hypothetical protein